MTDIRNTLNSIGLKMPWKPFFCGRKTSDEELLKLIKQLAPVDSGKNMIRIGPSKDGGYLLPDDFDGIEACFSPGVDKESGFELQLAERGIAIYMADASVDSPPIQHDRFLFTKKFIGSYDEGIFTTLNSWVNEKALNHPGDLILQIDIEGAEYEAFINMSEELIARFRMIVVEFHHLDYLFSKPYFDIAQAAFRKIIRQHCCVHIHPNNVGSVASSNNVSIPQMMEFTFYRKDRMTKQVTRAKIPHPEDVDCASNRATLGLPDCWLKD